MTLREELWMHGLSHSSPSSRQSGYLGICRLICCTVAMLCCEAEATWRVGEVAEAIWERGAYGDVGFAGGKLVVKIRKVKIAGMAEVREA